MQPALADGRYLHWDQLRRRPAPEGLTAEQWWGAQKLARWASRVEIHPFRDASTGNPFWYCRLDALERATHELDRRDAAREMLHAMGDEGVRHQYRFEQLIEEAINSSLIEGAKLTTRAEAKAMIRDGREPGTRGERMVWNNYKAMERLLALSDSDLTLDDVLEIHAILGDGALDTPDAEGRLRTAADDVRVEDATTGQVWFVPPPAHTLEDELEKLLTFANGPSPSGQFLHPLVRAIVLHFWLAYLHPFADGNGRMARALFYWQMLRSGYDFAQYLSISGPIDRAPRAYYLAFAYTETDGGDLTYFLLNQLAVLRQATDDLLAHLRDRSERLREIATVLSSSAALNHRKQEVLSYLIRNPHPGVTVNSHANSHNVSYLTARKDLHELEAKGLIRRARVGRADRYFATQDVTTKLRGGRQDE
jgi:Fic family protein